MRKASPLNQPHDDAFGLNLNVGNEFVAWLGVLIEISHHFVFSLLQNEYFLISS